MRYAALDYGTKYYGLAISDSLGKAAMAIEPIITRSELTAIHKLKDFCAESSIEHLVVGIPLGYDQKPTQLSQSVLEFIEKLQPEIAIPITTWNEVMTSRAASQRTKGTKIHSEAARIMLQEFLDHRSESNAQL